MTLIKTYCVAFFPLAPYKRVVDNLLSTCIWNVYNSLMMLNKSARPIIAKLRLSYPSAKEELTGNIIAFINYKPLCSFIVSNLPRVLGILRYRNYAYFQGLR